ncbi:Ribonuclease H [Auxenochlorella protothecoides]|uniref:Ribonuclease H n=1 Tax=Auxenochlorella protothecoides TaxID=3075 RepID=A0A087SEN4_AUXPR|nr:Ribonuclease H [Auxenochlorella protothecoides]KFM24188.1 Ribonuclease H [Auxenochlorella protothecoides]
MGKYSVYAVASGRNPGLYSSWGETESQVRQYSGSQYKGFHSVEAAQAYMESMNAVADALSNQAISEHRSGTTSQVWQLENPSTQQ